MASGPRRTRPRHFLPPDPRVEEPYRLTPQLALRVGILGALALAVFAVLFLRLWALEVLSGTQYLRIAQDNQLRTVRVPAPRGTIVDRAGKPLVTNQAGTAVILWPANLPKTWSAQRAELRHLSEIVGVPVRQLSRRIKEREGNPLDPVVVKEPVDSALVAYLKEHKHEFPGVAISDTYVRSYDHGSLAAHVLGSVGEITAPQLKRLRRHGYHLGDEIG